MCKGIKLLLAFFVIILISSFSFFSCSDQSIEIEQTLAVSETMTNQQSSAEVEKTEEASMEIIVTIPPLAEFVKAVAAEKANVTIMVPPGSSPHTYEPSRSQLVNLSNASMYAKVGTPIEFEISWLSKIQEMNKDIIFVDCSKNIDLIESKPVHEHDEKACDQKDHSHEGLKDPHIWLSLQNAALMVENIYGAIISVDPSNKDYYKSNKMDYIEEIIGLDAEIAAMLDNIENKKFMVYHDAWTYFAKDYDLIQIPIERDGKEPTPKGIKELIDQAREEEINVIFASPELNTASAEVIAQEIGAAVVLISPLEQDYLDNMRNISKEISKYLGQ